MLIKINPTNFKTFQNKKLIQTQPNTSATMPPNSIDHKHQNITIETVKTHHKLKVKIRIVKLFTTIAIIFLKHRDKEVT